VLRLHEYTHIIRVYAWCEFACLCVCKYVTCMQVSRAYAGTRSHIQSEPCLYAGWRAIPQRNERSAGALSAHRPRVDYDGLLLQRGIVVAQSPLCWYLSIYVHIIHRIWRQVSRVPIPQNLMCEYFSGPLRI
jgi:hypothetical protein